MKNLYQKIIRVKGEVGNDPFIVASAPGRADFLNTHQDYKGLPVVPIAISLRTYVFATRKLKNEFRIISLNLKEEGREYLDYFKLNNINLKGNKWFGDYLRAVILALKKIGKLSGSGLEVVIDSEVPVASGLASSAALEVAFTKLLDEYYGLNLSKKDIAEISYRAEREIMGVPCGRLDQYGSSYGGAILLYPKPPIKVERLPLRNVKIVIVDTGIKHSVSEIHPRRQEEINKGLRTLLTLDQLPQTIREKLGPSYDNSRWEEIKLKELLPYLNFLDEGSAKRIIFTIKMNESTKRALEIIRRGYAKLEKLGEIVNEQHELLRDLYEVSLPEIERIRDSMLKAGALGVKISGAGLGGSLIGIVRSEDHGRIVLESAVKSGAKRGWVVDVDEGVRVDYKGE